MSVGLPGQPKELLRPVSVNSVSPRYFETLGIRILHGRAPLEADWARGATFTPVVVSDALARTFWPGENPLGKRLRNEFSRVSEVAGVARDVSSVSYGELDGPLLYMPWNLETRGYCLLARFSETRARFVGYRLWSAPHNKLGLYQQFVGARAWPRSTAFPRAGALPIQP